MALHFELVTPSKLVRSEDVHMVVVPGTEGDFGVLEGHAPVMSTIREDGAIQVFASESSQAEESNIPGNRTGSWGHPEIIKKTRKSPNGTKSDIGKIMIPAGDKGTNGQ